MKKNHPLRQPRFPFLFSILKEQFIGLSPEDGEMQIWDEHLGLLLKETDGMSMA